MTTLRENIRRALTAPCECDFIRIHRWLMAQQAWPVARPAFARMMKMVMLFSEGRALASADLAGLFHVSVKTIGRDIDFLRGQLALPITYDKSAHVFRKASR